jgi:hypothetical protein
MQLSVRDLPTWIEGLRKDKEIVARAGLLRRELGIP